MSARDDLIEIVTNSPESSAGDAVWATDLVDAYRTEALTKAVGRLRAIPVDCTALTGPVWYGDGWNSAITCLEEIADYQTPDDEAYPGELQRLRALALGLRVAALRKEDLAEAQRLLVVHAEHEMDAREKATATAPSPASGFFQPGHRYAHSQWHFHCATVTAHPETGEHSAIGWLQISDGSWTTYAYSEAAWGDSWVDVTPAGDR